jgi:hypothetical protein
MTKKSRLSYSEIAIQQAAAVLLSATFSFLSRNNVTRKEISESLRRNFKDRKSPIKATHYKQLVRAYEDMGMVMSTWFSLPRFLDRNSLPLRLTAGGGSQSIRGLVRASRVKIPATHALELMRRSPSVRIDSDGKFVALKRVFVLPDFEVPRAALVINRYLDTLCRNSSAQRSGTTLLLERNCHVPEIDLKRITPILREIKSRGTAFMDSVDGDIEAHRIRRRRQKGVGELGVLIFAWTRPSKSQRSRSSPADLRLIERERHR